MLVLKYHLPKGSPREPELSAAHQSLFSSDIQWKTFNVSCFLSSSNLSSILKSDDWCSPSLRQYACASVSHLQKVCPTNYPKRLQAWPLLLAQRLSVARARELQTLTLDLQIFTLFLTLTRLCMSQGTKLTSRQLSSILMCYITDPTALLDQGAFLLLFQQVNSEVLQTALNEISVQVILASEWRTISSSLFRPYTGALQLGLHPQLSI